jgi:prepilin-type processing-associated H-X9-DG protein
MSEPTRDDEQRLIDYLLGQCDDEAAQAVRRRLAADADFAERRDRVAAALAVLDLLGEPEPPATLAERTVRRVREARAASQEVARNESRRRRVGPIFSWREVAGIAAAVLLLAVILVPSLQQARRYELAGMCEDNQGRIGAAMLKYAHEHDGALPAAEGSGRRWMEGDGVEKPASNSVALFKLVRDEYEKPAVFQCPAVGHGDTFRLQGWMQDFPKAEHVDYSYQHMVGPNVRRRAVAPADALAEVLAVLGDRNPLFDERGRFRPDRSNARASDNHDNTGQNVLYLDGHVRWSETPDAGVNGNNIWVAEGIRNYTGVEEPVSPTDTFLLPAYSR